MKDLETTDTPKTSPISPETRPPASTLKEGEVTQGEIKGGDSHALVFDLVAGEYAHIRVEQIDADLKLELESPGGLDTTEVDSPTGSCGPEDLFIVARSAGEFRVVLTSLESEGSVGRFEARFQDRSAKATPREEARVRGSRLYAKGVVLLSRRELEEARPLFENALQEFELSGDRRLQGQTQQRLGQSVSRTDPERAVLIFTTALQAFEEVGEGRLAAIVRNEIGSVHFRLGNLLPARAEFVKASEYFLSHTDPLGEATSLNGLGLVYKRAGEIHEALGAYQKAAALWAALERPKNLLVTEVNVGKLLLSIGKHEEAADYFGRCLGSADALDRLRDKAACLSGLGDIAQKKGEYEKALALLEEALQIRRELRQETGQGMVLNSQGNTFLKKGDLKEAELRYLSAWEIFEKRNDPANLAVTHLNLGRYDTAIGDYSSASTHFHQALELYTEIGHRSGQSAALLGLAKGELLAGRPGVAEPSIRRALDLVENLRAETYSYDLRSSVVARKSEYWELYVHILMELHEQEPDRQHHIRAFEVSERWRARSLLDLLQESKADIRSGVSPTLLEEEKRIRSEMNRIHLEMVEEDGNLDGGEIPDSLHRLELDLELVRGQIRFESPRYADLTDSEPINISGLQDQLLSSETMLLEYFLGEERSYAWSVTRDGIRSAVLAPRDEIDQAVSAFYKLLQTRSRSRDSARQRAGERLSNLLLAPLGEGDGSLSNQGLRRLVIVPDGSLATIPFAALPNPIEPKELLIDRFETVNLPSASALGALRDPARRRRAPQRKTKIAVFADPIYSLEDERVGDRKEVDTSLEAPKELKQALRDFNMESLPRLPYSREEALRIGELFKDRKVTHLGFDATRSSLLEMDLSPYSILHFATHALLNQDHPELSGLVLSLLDSDAGSVDGFLRLHDIYGLKLKAELVTLSACQTGLGKEIRGEGLVGLTRGFMYAGSPRVLVSSWNVDDEATSVLMLRFYEELFSSSPERLPSVSSALRRAQLSLLNSERWSAPYFWASFLLQGDWERPHGFTLEQAQGIGEDYAGPVDPDEESDEDMPCDGDHLTVPAAAVQDSSGSHLEHFLGVEAFSGNPAFPPLSEDDIFHWAKHRRPSNHYLDRFLDVAAQSESYEEKRHDPSEGITPQRLAETGWGVVFAEDTPQDVRNALSELLVHRKKLATRTGKRHYFRTFEYPKGQTVLEFLEDQRTPLGETAHPDRMPYYLMLVGSPEQIPFSFQYDLDLQYAVGRLSFDSADEYRNYAQTVLAAEQGLSRTSRSLDFFAARTEDIATRHTRSDLTRPLSRRLREDVSDWSVGNRSPTSGATAKEDLMEMLARKDQSALWFAAGHGLCFQSGHELQRDFQGALVCSEFSEEPELALDRHVLAAADLSGLGNLHGSIAFLFACYGGGTPLRDDFYLPNPEKPIRRKIAEAPFISRLAQTLLGRPSGAQAVVAHIERTWTSSFRDGDGRRQIETYYNALSRLMNGHPVGSALSRFDLRRAQIAAQLQSLNEREELRSHERLKYGRLWREQRDVRNFIVLGDPAVLPALGDVRS